MEEDAWTARRSTAPAPSRAYNPANAGSRVDPLDMSFVQLTVFFVKASTAAVLALGIVSVVVVGLAGVFAGAGVGVYYAVDGLRAVQPQEMVPSSGSVAALAVAAPVVVEAPPAILPPPPETQAAEVQAPVRRSPPSLRSRQEVERSNAATDAAIRAQNERMRANRQ